MSAFRGNLSVVLLAAAAIACLAIGSPGKAALAGAGFAFLGAAITRAIDIARERQAATADVTAARLRDLDETRRLAIRDAGQAPRRA